MQNQYLLCFLLFYFVSGSSALSSVSLGCYVESLNTSAYIANPGSARVFSLAPSLISSDAQLASALVCREMCALALYSYAGIARGSTCLCASASALASASSSPWLLTSVSAASCSSSCANGDQCGAPDPSGRTDSPLVLSVYTCAHNLLALGLVYGVSSPTPPLVSLSPTGAASSTGSLSTSIVASFLAASGTSFAAEVTDYSRDSFAHLNSCDIYSYIYGFEHEILFDSVCVNELSFSI